MSTILQIAQDLCREAGFPSPSSLIASTTALERQIVALAHDEVQKLRQFEWPQLSKNFTITLATSTANYALPADFDYWINRTGWDQSQDWELLGPLSAQEMKAYEEGVVSTGIRRKYRVVGFTSANQNVSGDPIPGWQIKIHPTPVAADNNKTLIKEYTSATAILPKQWVTSTDFGANSYCSNAGNIYKTTAGGTTGATPPTHTSGSASDGTVTWVYQSNPYEKFLADTDFPLISHELVKNGIKWRLLMENGLDYSMQKAEYDALLNRELAGLRGGRDVSLTPYYDDGLLGYNNIPPTGYGS